MSRCCCECGWDGKTPKQGKDGSVRCPDCRKVLMTRVEAEQAINDETQFLKDMLGEIENTVGMPISFEE